MAQDLKSPIGEYPYADGQRRGIDNQIGPYMYADGAIFEKAFGGRLFKVVIAGARNAGIIGPEDNGIAILDEDYQQIVLDNHVKESSGYFGPSRRQWEEAGRIMDMNWEQFTDFIRSHPRHRPDSVPDLNNEKPNDMRPEPDRIIFPASQKDAECPYDYSLESRREIIQFLANHQMHKIDGPYSDWAFAWNIKVHGFDTSGHHPAYQNDPAFDERWEQFLEENDIFWDEAADALSQYTDGEYTTYPGNDQGQYKFDVTGRSSGWLILREVEGLGKLSFDGQMELKDWLKELDDAELVSFYKLIVNVDKDTADPGKEMAYRFADRRSQLEAEWKAEAAPESGMGS